MTKTRTMVPQNALDFPHMDPELYTLWTSTGYGWPDARRSVSYLSATRLSNGIFVNGKKSYEKPGFALFTIHPEEAKTFVWEKDAQDFLEEHNSRRSTPYVVNLTTVSDLIRRKFNEGNAI